jgi:3-oxoacyl-[acyl-carrier protein] reductase
MKVVVITGTSRGVGEAIAMNFIKDGYLVVGVSRTPAAEQLSSESNFHQILFDLNETSKIPELCSRILKEFGAPFALVNNSALGLDGLLATQKNDDILLQVSVNLTAAILLTKYISRNMLEKREGRIINISSIVSSTGYKGLSVYAATKSALVGFTKSLSRELGSRNITVNCVHPGFLETDMSAGIGSEDLSKIVRRSALKRLPTVTDVANTVSFLAGVGGSNITGQSIVVDAGSSA